MLNDNKSSFGMYSRAGVQTTEKFHILMKKDQILSGKRTHIKSKGIFDPEANVI